MTCFELFSAVRQLPQTPVPQPASRPVVANYGNEHLNVRLSLWLMRSCARSSQNLALPPILASILYRPDDMWNVARPRGPVKDLCGLLNSRIGRRRTCTSMFDPVLGLRPSERGPPVTVTVTVTVSFRNEACAPESAWTPPVKSSPPPIADRASRRFMFILSLPLQLLGEDALPFPRRSAGQSQCTRSHCRWVRSAPRSSLLWAAHAPSVWARSA
jgi:hypothetical protein